MQALQEMKERVWGNKKTTFGGMSIGIVFAGIITGYLTKAGCDMSQLTWAPFLGYAGPQLVGAFTTDKSKADQPKETA